MAERTCKNFSEFWPHYLREHAGVRTRAIHYVGTAIVIGAFAALIVTGNAWWALAMPLGGYGFAWFANFFVERNRPATFTYPLWSLYSDFRMFFLAVSGKLGPHLQAAGVTAGQARDRRLG